MNHKDCWTPERRLKKSQQQKEYWKTHKLVHTEETKKLLSEQKKEWWKNPENRKKKIEQCKAYKPTEETIEKCRNASNKFWTDPENHKKASVFMKDRWAKIKSGETKIGEKNNG